MNNSRLDKYSDDKKMSRVTRNEELYKEIIHPSSSEETPHTLPPRKREARCAPFFLLPVSQSLSLDCDTFFSFLVLINAISIRSATCTAAPAGAMVAEHLAHQ